MNPGHRAPPERWRLRRLLDAPHRLAFLAGALVMGGGALWWALIMLARSQGLAPHASLPPASTHGLLMSLACMPLFFSGFLFTAGPRWLRCTAPPAAILLGPILAQLCGWLLFVLAAQAGRDPAFGRSLGALGLAAAALGWSLVLWRFSELLRVGRAAERMHARAIVCAGCVGALILWTAAWAIANGNFALAQQLGRASLWGFSGPVFVTALHRMLPFFGAAALPRLAARWPHALLHTLWALCALEACWTVLALDAPGWRAGLEGMAGIGVLALAIRWGRLQPLHDRMLAMLHLGWVWLGLALLLAALSHGLMAASEATVSLGLAPLHAHSMGFLGSILLAMVSRISCGHGGRTLTADNFLWRLFWLLQAATVLRVLTGGLIALDAIGPDTSAALLAGTALAWAGVCVAWGLRYGRWYGTPRADGRPG